MGIGFSKCRFSSTNRLSPGPWLNAWSCSGHSPPLSQTGQSSGWLARRSSSTPSCIRFTVGDWVSIFMSGATVAMQLTVTAGPRPVSHSTRHMRHLPTELIRSW